MATMKRIPVSLPKSLKEKLTALRGEGYSVSGYLKHLAEVDIQAREEAGWRAGEGWTRREENFARPFLPYPKHLHKRTRSPKRRQG